jgi:hypothetical protein
MMQVERQHECTAAEARPHQASHSTAGAAELDSLCYCVGKTRVCIAPIVTKRMRSWWHLTLIRLSICRRVLNVPQSLFRLLDELVEFLLRLPIVD